MPEIERDELALIYQAKGIDAEHAQNLATQVMADPEQMLAEQVQEELGIGVAPSSPFQDGLVTGRSTAGRGLFPLLPLLNFSGHPPAVPRGSIRGDPHFVRGAR